jgi:hypothetical protein
MLPELSLACYRFTLRIQEPATLPPYKGNVLRGGFGYMFRRMVCAQPERKQCVACLLQHHCAYGILFEPSPPPGTQVLRKNEAVPRPFVIEPPLDRRETFELGERLDFHVVLIGRSIAYLPYFILVFRQLGNVGLGRTRGRFTLEEVTALGAGEERTVFDVADGMIHTCDLSLGLAEWERLAATLPPDHITLDFLTPTRLKHAGRWVEAGPPFHVLVKVLLGRISSLSYFHCGHKLEADFRGLIDRAEAVRMAQSQTSWQDWSRFSGRQKQRVEMGGLVGQVTYAGDLRDYLSLLALGEWVHVGKGTVFGNGQYRIVGGSAHVPT